MDVRQRQGRVGRTPCTSTRRSTASHPDGVRRRPAGHADDTSREDVIALAPGEQVVVYRRFGTFTGELRVHCHNLTHEDHSMMFGWTIE